MKKVQLEDYAILGKLDFINWELFRGASILITGSTGLIGSNVANALAYNSQKMGLGVKLILPVRNADAAVKQFEWSDAEVISYQLGTELMLNRPVDYIIHLASPTNSKFFSERPADTMLANIEGTKALLEWAKDHPVKKFIYFSSMEVYGFPSKGHMVTENEIGAFQTMSARNSYPLAKIACEALCNSYYVQYHVPTVVLRATQTFGPGVRYDDGRVFAEFMRCAVEKKDIVLKTVGNTERSYLYTADAVSAILVSLLRAQPGEAYTVANPETYCSIKDMAQMVADEIAEDSIKVVYDFSSNAEKLGYASTLFMNLSVEKLQGLDWKARVGLKSMFERMIRGIKEDV